MRILYRAIERSHNVTSNRHRKVAMERRSAHSGFFGALITFAAVILWASVSAAQLDSTILKLVKNGRIHIGGLRAHGFASRHIDSLNGRPFDSTTNFSAITGFNDPWLASVAPTVSVSNDTLHVRILNNLDAGQLSFEAILDTAAHRIKHLAYDGATDQGFGMGNGSKSWRLYMHDLPYSFDSAGDLIVDMRGIGVLRSIDTFAMTQRIYQGQDPKLAGITDITNFGYPIDSTSTLSFHFQLGASEPAAFVHSSSVGVALKCYPNPAASIIRVELPNDEPQSISIVDILGRTRVRRKMQAVSTSVSLDIHTLESGMYFLLTSTGRSMFVVAR
jgi:hypothetical protein